MENCLLSVALLRRTVDIAFVEFGCGEGQKLQRGFGGAPVDEVVEQISILCEMRVTLR